MVARHLPSMFLGAAAFIAASLAHPLLLRDNTAFPYTLLKRSCIDADCSALRIFLANPPVKLWTLSLVKQFNTYLLSLNFTSPSTSNPKVVVISSDVPGFWASSGDVHLNVPNSTINATDFSIRYYSNLNLLSNLPIIFISETNERAWGAGDDHLAHMDIRFAGPDAQFGAPEVAFGLLHQGGSQWLVKAVGAGQAAEFLLSAKQLDANEAARIGWVNSMHASAEALRDYVDTLATRIALFDAVTLATTKASIAEQAPSPDAFLRDQQRLAALAARPEVIEKAEEFLTASNEQSREWELNLPDDVVALDEQ